MFHTRITDLLGIKYPILQGAMHLLSRAELVAAVSNAGGLGVLTAATFPTLTELRDEIKKTQSLTDKPFAVNVTLMPAVRPVNYEEYIATALAEGVKIIETSGRNPGPYMKLLKSAGVTTLHKVARVRNAHTAERLGVDAVEIIGFEAGGHPGMDDVTSLILIPRVVDTVNVPVVAGGGIGDARGFVAALALGAEGVLMGTRFMLSRECSLPPAIKERMARGNETDTLMIERSINNAARVFKTDLSRKVLDMETGGATMEELLPLIRGVREKQAFEAGDINARVISCGQVVGLAKNVPSVKEIIDGIIEEATAIMQRLGKMGSAP